MRIPEGETIEYWLRLAVGAATALLMLYSAATVAAADADFASGQRAYQAGDVVGAMPPLRRAAQAGHAPAQALLADILDQAGFVEDAAALYRQAAEKGDADGAFGLGALYSAGRGVERDPLIARKWIGMAAESGHARAINVLAQSYISGGLGLEKVAPAQIGAGMAWVHKAAAADYLPAIDYLAAGYRSGAFGPADPKQADALEARARELRRVNESAKTRR